VEKQDTARSRAGITSALIRLAILKGVAERTIDTLADCASRIESPAGKAVYKPGDVCTGLHIVASGRVKLSLPAPPSDERVIALLGPGAWFGETALMLRQRHVVAAETLSKAVLLHLAAPAVLSCLAADAAFAHRFLTETTRRLRGTLLELGALSASPAMGRVTDFLLRQLPRPAPRTGSVTIELPAEKRVIASRLDLTGSHLSRIFQELSRHRVIRVDGPRIHVPDVHRLRTFQKTCRRGNRGRA
jgi:CRP-like cAMP-binding protein